MCRVPLGPIAGQRKFLFESDTLLDPPDRPAFVHLEFLADLVVAALRSSADLLRMMQAIEFEIIPKTREGVAAGNKVRNSCTKNHVHTWLPRCF